MRKVMVLLVGLVLLVGVSGVWAGDTPGVTYYTYQPGATYRDADMDVTPWSIDVEGLIGISEEDLADILKRCLEFVPGDPPDVYYVGDHEDKRRQLRSDIERAIKLLDTAQ